MSRRSQQPLERRQPDLLSSECPACFGTGRQPWACVAKQLVNFYRLRRGLKPLPRTGGCQGIEFQTCGTCRGSGRSGGVHAGPQPF